MLFVWCYWQVVCIFVCWWVYCGFATVRWLRRITAVKLTCSSVNINARLLHLSEPPASRSQMNACWPLVVCFSPACWCFCILLGGPVLLFQDCGSGRNYSVLWVWCGVMCCVLCWKSMLVCFKRDLICIHIYIWSQDCEYIYIYLWSQDCGSGHLRFQNSLLWPVLLLVLINTAMPLIPRLWIGIITFDPKTVDLYKDFRSQDCGSFKLELSSEYGVVSCFLYWLSKLTWYEIMHGRGLMNSLYKSPHSFHLIRKKELPPEYPVTS